MSHVLLLCLSERQAASIIFVQHFSHFHLVLFLCLFLFALCQWNRTQAGLQNDWLASLVQSELLIRFSVRLTFVKSRRSTPAFPKSEHDGLSYRNTSLFYDLLFGFSSFYIILLEQHCMGIIQYTHAGYTLLQCGVCRFVSYCHITCNECTHMNTHKSTWNIVESDLFCYQSNQQHLNSLAWGSCTVLGLNLLSAFSSKQSPSDPRWAFFPPHMHI